MAEPVIIIKENPGKLRVEVWEGEQMLGGHTFENVPFSPGKAELTSDRPLFSENFARKGGKHGAHFEIKIKRTG